MPDSASIALAEAEIEIHSNIFGRQPEQDHDAKLRRVAAALHRLGDPHLRLRTIHVTGTNGKTSTSRVLESILRAHGLRTGLFTSPHLTTLRERIQVDGSPISQQDLVELWRRVAPAVHAVDDESQARGGPRMSFFEVLTVLGLAAFADAGVDVAVVEVGIGGQRDATNVITAEVAVLTPMANDHERYLTGGLVGIASEKSGIIKRGATVISAAQPAPCVPVITAAASERSARVRWEGVDLAVERVQPAAGGLMATLRTAAAEYRDVLIPLHGEFQAHNALLAVAAAEAALGAADPDAVVAGLAGATSPGRVEVVASDPTVVVDAAHNPHGIAALKHTLDQSFGLAALIGVVAVLADKDAAGILAGLEPVLDEVIVTRSQSPRATPVDELARQAVEVFGPDRVREAATVGEALAQAREWAGGQPEPAGVLVAGSITLVAEARRALQPVVPGTVESAQPA